MRRSSSVALFAIVLMACSAATTNGDRASIESVLRRYETALNTSDANAAVGIYGEFTIDEVKLLGDTAWVRTHSSGEMDVRAAGIKVPGKNSELFIFEKQKNGEWRVARYLFATQIPPKS